jgi:hypothetical protein
MFRPQIVDLSFLNQWVHWQYHHHIPASFKVLATIYCDIDKASNYIAGEDILILLPSPQT